MNCENTALVLVAGGQGTRMGGDLPKQYMQLNGREIIEHTISAFCASKTIGKIVIVCAKAYIDHVKSLAERLDCHIPVCVTEGGDTRQASVRNGLKLISDYRYVMIHDAVRCCITVEEILKISAALWQNKACALGVRVKDTIKRADTDSNVITETVNRDNLWHIQTPQAFVTSDIIAAHNVAEINGFIATDDCSVAEHAGMKVVIIEGSETNLKVTTPVDLLIASHILSGRSR